MEEPRMKKNNVFKANSARIHKRMAIAAWFVLFLTISIIAESTVFSISPTGSGETAKVLVDPEINDIPLLNDTFTISVKIVNVTGLYAFEIQFTWNPEFIRHVSHAVKVPVENYPGGVLHKGSLGIQELAYQLDENASIPRTEPGTRYWVAYSSKGEAESFSGSGTVFEMTFRVVGEGYCPLKILFSELSDKDAQPIYHEVMNGLFYTHEYSFGFRYPLDEHWTISQRFGRWNTDWQRYHLGEDVLRSFEAPVYAPANGMVKHNAKRTGYGYVVIIEHELLDGSFVCSVLGHLREKDRVLVGSSVTKDQIVGYLSSQPDENGGVIHLHYGIRKGTYSEELDFDGKWRYRGYGPIDIVGSWCPPSAFIEYYNENKEMPPNYDLTINTEGGGAFTATSSTSVYTFTYRTVLDLIATQPWWQRWIGTDNDYSNPTTLTMLFHQIVTALFRSEPPPPCPTPWELAKSLIGAEYSWGGQGWPWNLVNQGSHIGGKWLSADEIKAPPGYYHYQDPDGWGPLPGKVTEEPRYGLDCSGLIFWAYNKYAYEYLSNGGYGESLTDRANMIYKDADAVFLKSSNSESISKEQLQPGDLLFFDTSLPKTVDHVAMYVGNWEHTDGKTYNVTHATVVNRNGVPVLEKVVPALYNSNTQTLETEVPGYSPETLTVNKGYGRVFNYSDKAKPAYTCKSPIDLVVTDPDGTVLTKDVGEVPGMFYVEFDIDGDGELDDTVTVWDPKIGDYSITLIPEPGALPTDDFTLEASANGTTILLADHAQISEIPTDPYIITQNETSIMLRNINVATTNIVPSKNVVGQGYSLPTNVTVQNQGNLAETFNVTLQINTTSIATQTITLTSGNSTTITFTWDTTGFAKGNYTISAYAWPVTGETHTADNTGLDSIVTVTIPGDVDGDLENGRYDVDLYDAVRLLACYGAKEGDPNFDSNCDIDNTGQVFLFDAVILLSHYGQTAWPPE
jgi:murein DD-endopeptidase MepM/ murein hydrolase activator NlpD